MTVSAYHVIFPIAFVTPSIWPVALPFAVYHIVVPVAFVHRIVFCRSVNTIPCSLALIEHTFVSRAIWLFLFAFTMMQIILPIALVSLTIFVNVSSESVCSILEEGTRVFVPIRMVEYSFSLQNPISPIALIISTINPFLLSFAMLYLEFLIFFDYDFHLARINSSITLFVNSNILKLSLFFLAEFNITTIKLLVVE
jgi:hypothetical protein